MSHIKSNKAIDIRTALRVSLSELNVGNIFSIRRLQLRKIHYEAKIQLPCLRDDRRDAFGSNWQCADSPAESGAVYTMTNDASNNRILVYCRNSNGALSFPGSVSTQGRGSGGTIDPLEFSVVAEAV